MGLFIFYYRWDETCIVAFSVPPNTISRFLVALNECSQELNAIEQGVQGVNAVNFPYAWMYFVQTPIADPKTIWVSAVSFFDSADSQFPC
jgi:hypothetical protein